jgi:DNA-binding NarL/FixJ family response regulator
MTKEPGAQRHATATEGGGSIDLSQRQAEILALVAEGLQNKEIAYRLGISEATVKAHISKAIQLTGCRNRIGLAFLWMQQTGRLLP